MATKSVTINLSPHLTILLMVFVLLKLCGAINWSWLWVLCPLWIPIVFVCFIMFLIGLFALIALILGIIFG